MSDSMTLARYLSDVYSVTREIGDETIRQYRIAVTLFERWRGSAAALTDLDAVEVSAWLRDLAETRAPATVRAKRVQLMSLWRAAADDGFCPMPTRRVRSVRVPASDPVAWTHAEVCYLLAACSRLKRRHRCGLHRSVWWGLAIRVAWDTGLRWGDMVRLCVDQIAADGSVRVVQSKVRRPLVCQLTPSTMVAVTQSIEACPRKLLLPWQGSHETFCRQLRHLVRLACIRNGSWKWIRRGSATDVELAERGAATAHLGHSPGSRIAALNYVDPVIVGMHRARPRELAMPAWH